MTESDVSDTAMVYVIDDDEGARQSLEFLLDVSGIRVRTFASADAFLAAAPPLSGACVVTDVRMPGTGGVELANLLSRSHPAVPVIVVTGHADVPLAIQAMKAGAADFIEKPFDDETILSAIRQALARRDEDEAIEAQRREVNARLVTLSGRERDVVNGLVEGKAYKVIAADLGISPRTVEVYRANAMMKMQAKTLSELVRMMTIVTIG
jgi:two-component system response regulator FixJ